MKHIQAVAPRRENRAGYVAFQIPDLFITGYGLDFAGRYRNLPSAGVLHPHIYKEVSQHVCKK